MKKIFLLVTVLTTTLGSLPRLAYAENRVRAGRTLPILIHGSEDVPLGHWSYSAIQKILCVYYPNYKPHTPRNPVSRGDLVDFLLRCEVQERVVPPEAKDLFVALKYEFGMDYIENLAGQHSEMDGPYSDEDKKKIEFAQVAQKKYRASTPDEWSDFLDETRRNPLFSPDRRVSF